MESYSEIVSSGLNELLEKNYDAEKGYKNAAENTDHVGLKAFFNRKASQRYDFGHELKDEIRAFGEQPDKSGSITGDVHRVFMDLKKFLSSSDNEAVLEEAIRGEKATIENYENVLEDTTLPPSTKAILERQKAAIEQDLSTIKSLEDLQ